MRGAFLLVVFLLAAAGLAWCADEPDSPASYVHTFTGFTYPPQLGKFTRHKITTFNPEKSDIEVDYWNDSHTTLLSAYVYPAHDPMQAHYQACRDEVLKVYTDVKLLAEAPVGISKNGTQYDGLSARFSMKRKLAGPEDVEALSQLRLFQYHDYWVLYRISYLQARQKECEEEIDDFLVAQVWPGA